MKSTTTHRRTEDRRGSSKDRRVRKLWMLSTFGNGETVPCSHCSDLLTYDTVEADRIEPGGSYARWNVQPACRNCNAVRGDDPNWTGPNPTNVEHPLAHLAA